MTKQPVATCCTSSVATECARYGAAMAAQSVSATTIVTAAMAASIVGLTFGMYPALRAARLSPIDAIRHE